MSCSADTHKEVGISLPDVAGSASLVGVGIQPSGRKRWNDGKYRNSFNYGNFLYISMVIAEQRGGMMNLEQRIAEVLWYFFCGEDFFRNKLDEGIKHYRKAKQEFEDKDSPWFNRKHMGDCTKECNSCITCQIEDIEKQAKAIASMIKEQYINPFCEWHKKAHTTPEMLLSSKHEKSDECAEIMKEYYKAIHKLFDISDTDWSERLGI